MERRHVIQRLERIAGRDHQPDLIQPQMPPRQFGDMAVAGMRRIERTAEQPDPHPPSVTVARQRLMRRVGMRGVVMRGGWGQGRTWPLPVTT
jgi:hypothetical protein